MCLTNQFPYHFQPTLQAFARFLYEEGNPDRARLLFRRSTDLDPKHQPSWQAWAIMEWREGDVSKSRELFQKGIWAAPRGTSVAKVFQVSEQFRMMDESLRNLWAVCFTLRWF